MQKRTIKVALLAVLAIILVLSFSGVALADQTWSDLPDTVTAKYGITDNQVAAISEGFWTGSGNLTERHPRAVHQDGCGGLRYRPDGPGHRPSRTFPKVASTTSTSKARKPPVWSTAPHGTTFAPKPPSPVSRLSPSSAATSPRPTATTWPPCTRRPRSTAFWRTSVTRPASPPTSRPKWRSRMTSASRSATPTAMWPRRPT